MNKLIIIIFGTFLLCNCKAQQEAYPKKLKPRLVHVNNWGKKSLGFSEDFWDGKKNEIINQIGEDEFNKVLKNCDYTAVPRQLTGMFIKDKKGFHKKLDSLKVYEIATFSHFYQEKDWGKYSILWCPYNVNKNWDSTVKWDDVYFIIEKDAVDEIESEK